ncbi:lysostaphin resistance A-like protein [Undibacterium sp. RuTC16W]|uniref:CPBP family intramembrane glutamic endopeptidase n=1 Tax=Undibacterium sp. RuTC16W TaxID=3413048 RepID=UPI003BF24081
MTRSSMAGPLTFVLVAFGIPWIGWLFVQNEDLSIWLFPLFASIAGFAAAFADGGTQGLVAFCQRVFGVLSVPRYVLVAVLIPLALGFSYLFTTGVPVSSVVLSPAAMLSLSLGAALVTGPLAEEFGWRGYVQPALLRRLAPFWAALVTGLIWWAWHCALYRDSVFAAPASALRFLTYLETWSIFAVFLVQRARGSVWPAVALHWAANTHPDILRVLLPSVDGGSLPGGSTGWLFYLAAACAFTVVNRGFYFTRQADIAVPHARANNSPKPTLSRGEA